MSRETGGEGGVRGVGQGGGEFAVRRGDCDRGGPAGKNRAMRPREGLGRVPDEPKCAQCEEHADCVPGERCVAGGCYAPHCGDGLVDDDEVCDDPQDSACRSDCTHSYDVCNPLSDFGCAPEETCVVTGYGVRCQAEPHQGPGDGEACGFEADFTCAEGLACADKAYLPGCPELRCCTPLCNLQKPDTCPSGRARQGVNSNYVGVCLPPP